MTSSSLVGRVCAPWFVIIFGAPLALGCGAREDTRILDDASPESANVDALQPDNADAETQAETCALDSASPSNDCADRCFAGASTADYVLRASSCVCTGCPDCRAGEMCGGASKPTDACVRCLPGLFAAGGACTKDSSYRTFCEEVPHCKAISACLLACASSPSH